MLRGGLLPFPRTGGVLYANAILPHRSLIRQASCPDDVQAHGERA